MAQTTTAAPISENHDDSPLVSYILLGVVGAVGVFVCCLVLAQTELGHIVYHQYRDCYEHCCTNQEKEKLENQRRDMIFMEQMERFEREVIRREPEVRHDRESFELGMWNTSGRQDGAFQGSDPSATRMTRRSPQTKPSADPSAPPAYNDAIHY